MKSGFKLSMLFTFFFNSSLAIFVYRRTRVEDLDADINSASCEKYE